MIEILATTATGTCVHCGRPITRLTANATPGRWTHNPEPGRGVFQRHCPGQKVATPESTREEPAS